ncbi:MAG TPA: class I SAM-dependent methyltransferase [Thermoanaerobaculia bacterium]|nr:class I SAM-dependent methyltransferase [Thermoanaerobaculia bacterium]
MNLNVLTIRHLPAAVRLGLRKLARRIGRGGGARRDPAAIDVRDLIRDSSPEELNRLAEEYFSKLPNWDFHLAKPFHDANDAPALLINFATAIQGLEPFPGARVLDFGAGSGWTSRYLTQLGCQVVVLDLSPTALRIARELFARQPVVGALPEPEFLEFDGRRISLPDASVDRILSFDAFHHVPDPDATLAELARVLRPGGIATFSEPGPEHSKTEHSQHEMRTWGVIENDVDVHAIWRRAHEVGFTEIRMAACFPGSYQVSLRDYDQILAGRGAYLEWAETTRSHLKNIRNFSLVRAGEEARDSRRREGLAARIAIRLAGSARAGAPLRVEAEVRNVGRSRWLPSNQIPGGVSLGCHLYDDSNRVVENDFHWEPLASPPRPIEPGEAVSLSFELPPLSAGAWELEFDCVADRVTWFGQVGSATRRVAVRVEPAAAP